MAKGPVPVSQGVHAGEPDNETTAMVLYSDNAEAVEWLNMCWRKVGQFPIFESMESSFKRREWAAHQGVPGPASKLGS